MSQEMERAVCEGEKRHLLFVDYEEISADKVWFISSGTEFACWDLEVDGLLRNDGKLSVYGVLTVNGELKNNGTVEVGW